MEASPGRIEPEYVMVERFDAGSPASLAYLEEHGYVVIGQALDQNEVTRALDLMWDYLEQLGTGIDRNDWHTWDNDRWPTQGHGGILPGYGIGHSAAQWYIRSMPAVVKAFAAIWDTDDLLASFDGMAIWRPWTMDPAWKTERSGTWLHIDQHPVSRPGKQCVQGLVNLVRTSPATGGNVLVPGSHKLFADLPRVYEQRLGRIPENLDHFRFPVDDPLLAGTTPTICHLEPGDLLLWDSRTIHCSNSGLDEPDHTPDLLRAVSLVCMMPRRLTSQEVIERRKRAVQEVVSTTNWTDEFVNGDHLAPLLAEPHPERFKRPPPPVLNEFQRKLVGY